MAAANRRQVVFDSRLPVGENSSTNDATHPRNIVLQAANTEAQAGADQRYDINPPPRVEPFSPANTVRNIPFLVNVFVVCVLFVIVMQIKQRFIKAIVAVAIIFVLHQVIKQFESRCMAKQAV